MPQAIIDPENVRRFASNLKRFNEDLRANMTAMHAQMNELSATWRDQEQQKFQQEFEVALQAINRFVDATNQHVPFLLRKARRAEEYLEQR